MTVGLLIGGTLLLAWSNGANDNFKGVATLHGSGALSYRAALSWAGIATLAGGLVSVLLAGQLVKTFSGAAILHGGALDPAMLAAMLAAAGGTVLLASIVGMPTSTTHALMGSLMGVVLVVDPARIRFDRIGALFLGPMLLSPLLAMGLAAGLFAAVRLVRRRMPAKSSTCLCVGVAAPQAVSGGGGALAFVQASVPATLSLRVGNAAECAVHAEHGYRRLDGRAMASVAHGLSGGAVCFARSLNDTPKIAAVLLTTGAIGSLGSAGTLALVTVIVVAGGFVGGRRVAQTMSRRITPLGTQSGLTANLVTAGLVLWASRLGLPVSTTHVSCSSIFGIGAVKRQAERGTIVRILTTWVTTLPFAAALGAGTYAVVRFLETGA